MRRTVHPRPCSSFQLRSHAGGWRYWCGRFRRPCSLGLWRVRNVLHSGQDQTGAIFLSTGKKKSEKITCKTTHHVWVRHTTSGRYLLWEPAHCSYIAFLFYLCAHFLYCHMFSLTKKAWHSPAYRIPSAVGLDSAQ